MTGVAIVGHGHYAPDRIVANSEIETRLGLEAGWIKRRTGIEARRYAAPSEALSDIAIKAGEMALSRSCVRREDIGLLLLATSTPDHLLPPTAPLVAHRLGLEGAGAIDMAGACAGFLYAFSLADSFVRTQGASVLVIAANILSRRINARDRGSSALFADAAGAVVLAPTARSEAGIAGVQVAAKGQAYDLIKIPGGGSRMPFAEIRDPSDVLMVMNDGKAVYAGAVSIMTECAEKALTKAGLSATDVDYFIPHQANARMMQTVAQQLQIPLERLRTTISEFGNSSAATIPFTLSATAEAKPYKPGDIVLMTAAGAGLIGGAAVLTW
jgi:3-oxoacyl-[acyl-carrier-protein] synthase III